MKRERWCVFGFGRSFRLCNDTNHHPSRLPAKQSGGHGQSPLPLNISGRLWSSDDMITKSNRVLSIRPDFSTCRGSASLSREGRQPTPSEIISTCHLAPATPFCRNLPLALILPASRPRVQRLPGMTKENPVRGPRWPGNRATVVYPGATRAVTRALRVFFSTLTGA